MSQKGDQIRAARRAARDPQVFEPINLDGLDAEDLALFQDLFGALARYAQYKGAAMIARAAGRIPIAVSLERDCEKIYNTLPDWARW